MSDKSATQQQQADAPDAAQAEMQAKDAANQNNRRRWLTILGIALLVVALGYAVWYFVLKAPEESTDNAYVAGDVIAITARDPGTVIALYADDTEQVREGQPLVDLDPATADAELKAAAARLGEAVRAVRGNVLAVTTAEADVGRARIELDRANKDLKRRQVAVSRDAISIEEASHAADAVKLGNATLTLAQSRLAQAKSQVEGANIRNNPSVLAAIAVYRKAAIQRSHMQIIAPVSGTLAKRSVQIGQQVSPGAPLMAVVPLNRVWVDANFRETQLADLRVGQPVRITTDTYGGKVVFHGKVQGLGAGSGNAFALLPPQNATGNWIKIVQRVPVRIALDPAELEKHPLRIGLSVTVSVDTSDQRGSALGTVAKLPLATQASVNPDVEADIDRIIAANSGARQ